MKYLALAVILIAHATAFCPNDSTDWCRNIETAKSCNVVKQCWDNVWSQKEPILETASYDVVNFTLYYETLCPDCKEFMTSQVLNAFLAVKDIMNLTLVPFGNAQETWRNETKLWQFSCQHGGDECWGNNLHTCLIHFKPKTEDHLPFIICMEANNVDDIQTSAEKCASKYSISLDQLTGCVYSKLGNGLQHEMAVRTNALNPPHKYVPWVTLNGQHTEDIQKQAENDLVGLICKTYKGPNKPDACNQKKTTRKCLKN